ncbi:hypothetical protein PTSG_04959 [Salpingoeca rosetta]|uniref:Transmembrane protein n=1 Tax=Salpingoeca rosetta (strain ATCC 50818 / BSB-021) TaxID=946362 RepID=F2U940_SALR5|nr:uncharacterized protein PTSG_04959 [Salpingoeca rosetta]EGD73243.1 hypothetical protein PTSG_04959 [Salpingoeca rosetta]|eukprot:XP_004994274.1 hypothetical protein PTSG_04959 [Salpingoeca rosetta]
MSFNAATNDRCCNDNGCDNFCLCDECMVHETDHHQQQRQQQRCRRDRSRGRPRYRTRGRPWTRQPPPVSEHDASDSSEGAQGVQPARRPVRQQQQPRVQPPSPPQPKPQRNRKSTARAQQSTVAAADNNDDNKRSGGGDGRGEVTRRRRRTRAGRPPVPDGRSSPAFFASQQTDQPSGAVDDLDMELRPTASSPVLRAPYTRDARRGCDDNGEDDGGIEPWPLRVRRAERRATGEASARDDDLHDDLCDLFDRRPRYRPRFHHKNDPTSSGDGRVGRIGVPATTTTVDVGGSAQTDDGDGGDDGIGRDGVLSVMRKLGVFALESDAQSRLSLWKAHVSERELWTQGVLGEVCSSFAHRYTALSKHDRAQAMRAAANMPRLSVDDPSVAAFVEAMWTTLGPATHASKDTLPVGVAAADTVPPLYAAVRRTHGNMATLVRAYAPHQYEHRRHHGQLEARWRERWRYSFTLEQGGDARVLMNDDITFWSIVRAANSPHTPWLFPFLLRGDPPSTWVLLDLVALVMWLMHYDRRKVNVKAYDVRPFVGLDVLAQLERLEAPAHQGAFRRLDTDGTDAILALPPTLHDTHCNNSDGGDADGEEDVFVDALDALTDAAANKSSNNKSSKHRNSSSKGIDMMDMDTFLALPPLERACLFIGALVFLIALVHAAMALLLRLGQVTLQATGFLDACSPV